ncbi:hypothetical protein NKH41_30185, partial [Mesorhizobium sp. M1169]
CAPRCRKSGGKSPQCIALRQDGVLVTLPMMSATSGPERAVGASSEVFAALTPEIVIGCVERRALDGSTESDKAIGGVVRAFLRYLHVKGAARQST